MLTTASCWRDDQNMTTVLFLTFYYALLFPAGYFFAAVTLTAHYWTDKYCRKSYTPQMILLKHASSLTHFVSQSFGIGLPRL